MKSRAAASIVNRERIPDAVALSLRIEMKSAALMNAPDSLRSSSLRRPSFARPARTSMRVRTAGATRNSATRWADSASKQRLKGSKRPSSGVATSPISRTSPPTTLLS
jgi:hypothetical protein